MRTPIVYYGGKHSMLPAILPRLWSPRRLYCEPFLGGGAVFFGKPRDKCEVVNDKDNRIVNFYRVAKTPAKFAEMAEMAEATPLSQALHEKARAIWRGEAEAGDVESAWAMWYLSATSFEHIIGASLRTVRTSGKTLSGFASAKRRIQEMAGRLDGVQIMQMDAVDCIRKFDFDGAFFYVDPPYVGADQGHYAGYGQADFDRLLDCLAGIKGKFLLSSYENGALSEMSKAHGWRTGRFASYTSFLRHGAMEHAARTELLTANYDMEAMAGMSLW